jgi:lipoate synthase
MESTPSRMMRSAIVARSCWPNVCPNIQECWCRNPTLILEGAPGSYRKSRIAQPCDIHRDDSSFDAAYRFRVCIYACTPPVT